MVHLINYFAAQLMCGKNTEELFWCKLHQKKLKKDEKNTKHERGWKTLFAKLNLSKLKGL